MYILYICMYKYIFYYNIYIYILYYIYTCTHGRNTYMLNYSTKASPNTHLDVEVASRMSCDVPRNHKWSTELLPSGKNRHRNS